MWFAAIVVRLDVIWSVLSLWVSWFGDFPPVPAIHWLNATQMRGTRSARPQCARFLLDIVSWSIPQACYVAESNWRTHFWMGFGCQLKIAGKTTEANCPRCLYWYSQLPPQPSTTTCVYHLKIHLLSGKLRWQWNMDPLKMYFRLNMGIFHSYVSLPESNSRQLSKALTASPNIGHGFCLGQVGAFRVESVEHGEIVFLLHGFSWKWVTPKHFLYVFSPSIIRRGRLPTHTQVLSILLAMQWTTCQRCQEDICQAVPWKDQGIKSGRNISFLMDNFKTSANFTSEFVRESSCPYSIV